MAAESLAQLDCVAIEPSGDVKECGVEDFGFCAICLDKILLQETALVKGCEHAYCVNCILQWASYKDKPSCPQCKHPFESLNVHRSLDGCIHDYMFEESVILLLRASWFIPVNTGPHLVNPSDASDELYQDYLEESELYDFDYEDELEVACYDMPGGASSSIRIGNRRWGDNGFVRAGRREARPVRQAQVFVDGDCEVGPVHQRNGNKKGKEKKEGEEGSGSGSTSKDLTGRRAKRAIRREAADRAAAEKHKQILQRLGRA